MKAPTSLFDRPGRAAAVVGAVVAVSATAAVALVAGTAAADEPGRCTENVNVRSEPDVASRIVALCEAGTQVKVGEARDGFVQLTNLGGWAAQEYVSVNGRSPAPAERNSTSEGEDGARTTEDGAQENRSRENGTADEGGAASEDGAGDSGERNADEAGEGSSRANPGGGLGGLLG